MGRTSAGVEVLKRRGLILLGLALLVGSVLLVGRHWFVDTVERPIAAVAPDTTAPSVETQHNEDASPRPQAAANSRTTASAPTATTSGLRGRVIDAVTRQPIKQFDIRITRWDREADRLLEPITKTFRGETGRFTWSDLPSSASGGSVTAPGYQLFNLGDAATAAGQTSREVVVPLLRGHAVRGRVFERSTGAGIGGAHIGFNVLTPSSDYRWRSDTKSNDDGSFVLDGVPAGEVTLIVRAEGHGTREIEIVVDDKTPEQEVALSAGGTIAGTVTTAAGVPVKSQIVLFGASAGNRVETDDGGQFSFKHLPAGKYSLTASGPNGGGARQTIELGEDERKEGITLAFASGRSVRGTIKGLRPEEVERTYVGLYGQRRSYPFLQARPDPRGAYVFATVPPGPARLSVHTPSRSLFKAIDVPADRDLAVDIVLSQGVRVSGRITQGGKPVRKMLFLQPTQSEEQTHYRTETSEDGLYEIEGVVPGEYRFGSYEEFNRPITIVSDTVANIDIPMVELAGGVLEDGSAVPIVDANVFVRGIEPGTSHVRVDRTTDDFGEFKLLGLEPGEVVLTVYKPGYELYREKIVYGSPITNKKVTLRKGGGVEVRAQVKAGSEQERGFTIVEDVPNNEQGVHFWIPLDSDGIGYVPRALAGSDLEYYSSSSNKWMVVREWDGRALDLKL